MSVPDSKECVNSLIYLKSMAHSLLRIKRGVARTITIRSDFIISSPENLDEYFAKKFQ